MIRASRSSIREESGARASLSLFMRDGGDIEIDEVEGGKEVVLIDGELVTGGYYISACWYLGPIWPHNLGRDLSIKCRFWRILTSV